MPYAYRNISYKYMLFETLRNEYSVNAAGQMSILFKYMACFVQPLIAPFDAYNTARQQSWLLAQCAWQIGQLTNVLNYIYDPLLKRIYIVQATSLAPQFKNFGTTAVTNIPNFGEISTPPFRNFGEAPARSGVVFMMPNALAFELDAIKASIAQVAIEGIPYTIQTY